MINPSPYKTIAVASTFSPRFEQVLSEAKRMRDRFSSDLRLIYVGERREDTPARFRDALSAMSLPVESTIYYEEGDPADGILRTLRNNKIDMIVAGAFEKEVVLHQFLGNVARRLVREAACSVMLFTKPEADPKPLRRMVFVADESYSDHTRDALQTTFQLALAEKCERLYVIRIFTTFDEARASRQAEGRIQERAKTLDDEEAALEKFILSAGATDVPIEARCIRGNTGLIAGDFVQSVDADLLVVPDQPEASGDQVLPRNVAWITDVIPCNLWLIR
jgi:nucleotide-binding universal stress UspA family protein